MSERNYLFDNLKVLLIFLVVAVHMCAAVRTGAGAIQEVDFWLLVACTFHMPLFMIISGYFSKKFSYERIENNVLIYLFAQFLFAVYDILLKRVTLGKISIVDFLEPAFSMWYLYALIFMRIFSPMLIKLKGAFFILVIVSVLTMGYGGEVYIVRIFANLIYFYIGLVMKPEMLDKIRKIPQWIYLVGFGLGILVLYLSVIKIPFVEIHFLRLMFLRSKTISDVGFGVYGYLIYAAITIFAIYMSFMVLGMMSDKKNVFTFLGQNTIIIYIVQAFMYLFAIRYFESASILPSKEILYVLALILSIVCVLVFGNKYAVTIFNKIITRIRLIIFKN